MKLSNVLMSAAVALGLCLFGGTVAKAHAAPPATPPLVTAEAQGNDIVMTFPEGTCKHSVSMRVGCHCFSRGYVNHSHQFRWTSPTELRFTHRNICNPHEGIWVYGETKGALQSLCQFVLVRNLPMYHVSGR
jgi:hypothetical protein